MPRKKKAKAPEAAAIEPAAPEVPELPESIRQSREAKAAIEPERPMPEPEAEQPKPTFVERVTANRPDFRPVPRGFVNVDRYEAAGFRVNRSIEPGTVAIQFAEDRLPTRAEKDQMEIAGFRYEAERRQWERTDRENPIGNLIDGKRFGQLMSDQRTGQQR